MLKKISQVWKFISTDIWRITENEVNRSTYSFYNLIKVIFISVNRFNKDRIINKASALTYSTLFAIVPILAILFAIARGFGFSSMMEEQVIQGFGGPQNEATHTIISFIDSYLAQTKGGIFVGVGLIMLLWSVTLLINNIEVTFNRIWQVRRQRTLYRQVTDYFSVFLLLPILMVVSSGVSIYTSTMLKSVEGFIILAPIIKFLVRMIPYVLIWLMFTALYAYMPNTRVKFKYAFISGVIAGSAYQAFQFLYIGGQIAVSRYNAIYGSFAALPLFLIWVQISWTICLFGAELTYAGQNITNFNFEKDTRNISRRYRDFIMVLILSLITKRFEKNGVPYTAEELSKNNQIPIRLTNQILFKLQEINLIHEVAVDYQRNEVGYHPSVDINRITVAEVLNRIDSYGSEDFKVDRHEVFKKQWEAIADTRMAAYKKGKSTLLKDL